jgi:lipid A ethanolaminephosphotransferase
VRVARPALRRPSLRVESLVALVACYLTAAANGAWWSVVWAGRSWSSPATWLFTLCCFVALATLHFILLSLVSFKWTVKPVLSVVVVTAAAAAHFMRTYHVLMDHTMMQSVVNTGLRETRELLSPALFVSIVVYAAPALFAIWLVRIERRPYRDLVRFRLVSLAAAVAVVGLALAPITRDMISFMRNERTARYLITPGNVLYGAGVSLFGAAEDSSRPRTVIGMDARVAASAGAKRKPRVVVLIVGETARAASFSLLGYDRATNPQLEQRKVLAFANVTSCGTSTEVSVPCMFSPFGRADYDERRIRQTEGLLDVLVHADVAVKWLDNQMGCKGVCQNQDIEVSKLGIDGASPFCTADECHDEILVERLAAEITSVRQDTVLVLHMMGNHGPGYFRRYPPEFRRFTPECATAELRDCTREEVVNSYDNAISYTDFVVAKVVDALAARSRDISAGMLYVSDHGESLGEGNLYLHGMPYALAPAVQTHVPMIAWLSDSLITANALQGACLPTLVDGTYSHDNLFDTMLGLFDVQTSIYRRGRDVFATCRG